MTKAEKIKAKQERSHRRKDQRIQKDKEYAKCATQANNDHRIVSWNHIGISWGRRRTHRGIFMCEMGYSDCEARGFCNGDC